MSTCVKQTAVSDDPPDTDDFFVVWNANRVNGDYHLIRLKRKSQFEIALGHRSEPGIKFGKLWITRNYWKSATTHIRFMFS